MTGTALYQERPNSSSTTHLRYCQKKNDKRQTTTPAAYFRCRHTESNPCALRTAKTLWRFGCSECNRAKKEKVQQNIVVVRQLKNIWCFQTQCHVFAGPNVFGFSIFCIQCRCRGCSGGAMVLGKLPVPVRPTIWITVGQGPTALAVGAGGGCLDIFTLIYPFFPLSPSLWETARYRLKYCLKGPLNPKPTNHQCRCICHWPSAFLSQSLLMILDAHDVARARGGASTFRLRSTTQKPFGFLVYIW